MTDLMDPPSSERPRIDPRIAKRWIDARRQEGRRRLHALLVLGGVAAVVALAIGSLFTPLFSVRHERITVDGAVPTSDVARLAGVRHSTLTINVNAGAIARRLDADPWLGAAQVARHWPGTVTIAVVARTPLAVVALAPPAGTGWAEVDPTGRVLADLAAPPPGVPVLQGIRSVPAPGGWLAGTAGAKVAPLAGPGAMVDMAAPADGDVPAGPAAALAFLQSLPPLIRSDVLSVNASAGPGLSLVISPPRMATGTVTVLLGDGSQLQAKVTALLAILDQGHLSGVAGLDLSVPARPATAPSVAGLTPAPPATAPGSASASTSASASATSASGAPAATGTGSASGSASGGSSGSGPGSASGAGSGAPNGGSGGGTSTAGSGAAGTG